MATRRGKKHPLPLRILMLIWHGIRPAKKKRRVVAAGPKKKTAAPYCPACRFGRDTHNGDPATCLVAKEQQRQEALQVAAQAQHAPGTTASEPGA